MTDLKMENNCGCNDDSCCPPKSPNKRRWTTFIFIIIIVAAGALISYKFFCPHACNNNTNCTNDSTSNCCPASKKTSCEDTKTDCKGKFNSCSFKGKHSCCEDKNK